MLINLRGFLSSLIFPCSAEFVYKNEKDRETEQTVCRLSGPLRGSESLVFGNNDDASAIFLPAANRASKLLRRNHSLLLFLSLIIANNFSYFFHDTNLYFCFSFSLFRGNNSSIISFSTKHPSDIKTELFTCENLRFN